MLVKWWAYLCPPEPFDPAEHTWLAWVFSGEMIGDTISSLYRVVVGFAVGAGLALPLGLIMGANDRAYALFNPLIQVLRPIPPIAYIPLAILWFGLGDPPAVFLISIGAFFPVLMNTVAGVHHVDGIYIRAARNLGAGQMTMFVRVMIPAATPYILAGARISIDGVIGFVPHLRRPEGKVLRSELMIERGLYETATSIRKRKRSHETLRRPRRLCQRNERLYCRCKRQDLLGEEGSVSPGGLDCHLK